MFFKIWIVNALLMAFLIFVSIRIYGVWFGKHNHHRVVAVDSTRLKETGPCLTQKKLPDSFYDAIVKNNIFSPDRGKSYTNTGTDTKGAHTINIGEKIFLYGIVISGSYRKALLSIPVNKKREKKLTWMGVGDEADNVKIIEIEKEDVIIKDGAQKYKIFLYDKDKPEKIFKRLNTANTARLHRNRLNNGEKRGLRQDKSTAKKAPPFRKSDGIKYRVINTPFGKIRKRIK